MRLGFDIDGVLGYQDTLAIIQCGKDRNVVRMYYQTVPPNFAMHPANFSNNGDETFILTARGSDLKDITEAWCHKFFPNIPVIMIDPGQWEDSEDWSRWFKSVAIKKAKVINELKLDVYFEDMPETVEVLRELCPSTKIIQYGGRLR